MSRIHRHLAGLIGGVFLFAPAAYAEAPVETALKALVAGIDASPDWTARYASLAYDPATDAATLSGLAIGVENGGLTADFNTISVVGYAAIPAGGFAAQSIAAGGMTVDAGIVKLAIDDVDLEDLVIPAMPALAYDRQHPFTSLMRAYAGILNVKLASARIGSLAMIQQMAGVTSRVSYEHFRIDGFENGKIAAIRAGPLHMETPSPEGLVTMTVGSVESRDTDLGAFIRVYDPDYYAGGVGDMVWHTALGLAAYHDIEMELPGLKLAVRQFSVENFKLRQPKESFGDFLDTIMVNASNPMARQEMDEMARRHVGGMLSAFGVGRFGLEGLEVQAEGINRFALDSFHISDFSSDGLGEFAIDGLEGTVEGQGSVKIGRFAFGGVIFPSFEALMAASSDMGPLDPMAMMPKLGFAEALGIDMTTPDVPRTRLDKFRVDLGNYVGALPTAVTAEVTGFDVPVATMNREGRETLRRLGYDRMVADYGLKFAWDESKESLVVDDLHFGIKDMGRVAAKATVAGLTRAALENPTDPSGFANLSLVDARLTFTDESIVLKSLDLLAERMKVPSEKFRQQFAEALPFLLSVSALNNPTVMAILKESGLLAKLTPAVKTFVASPGSLIVSLAPAAPVALGAIVEAANGAPQTLPGLLNLTLTAEPGMPLRPTTPPPN